MDEVKIIIVMAVIFVIVLGMFCYDPDDENNPWLHDDEDE